MKVWGWRDLMGVVPQGTRPHHVVGDIDGAQLFADEAQQFWFVDLYGSDCRVEPQLALPTLLHQHYLPPQRSPTLLRSPQYVRREAIGRINLPHSQIGFPYTLEQVPFQLQAPAPRAQLPLPLTKPTTQVQQTDIVDDGPFFFGFNEHTFFQLPWRYDSRRGSAAAQRGYIVSFLIYITGHDEPASLCAYRDEKADRTALTLYRDASWQRINLTKDLNVSMLEETRTRRILQSAVFYALPGNYWGRGA